MCKNSPSQAEITARVHEIAKTRSETTEIIAPCKPLEVLDYSQMVVGKELGAGSFSCAYEIKRIGKSGKPNNGKPYILKKLSKKVLANPYMFAACAADLLQEGRILGAMDHRNVLDIRGWSGEDMIEKYINGSRDSCYLVIERLDYNLEDQLAKWKDSAPSIWNMPSTRKQLKFDLLQEKVTKILHLAKALEHLHSHRVLHRDLKPQNIGFDTLGVLKVYDFDLSRVLPPSDDENKAFKMTAKVGSPRYMAPEVVAGDPYNLKADVFSFGLLTYQILTLKTPFKGLDYNWSKANKSIPKSWSSDVRLEMENCLSPQMIERPNMKTLVIEIERALTSADKDDETAETDAIDFGLCGVALPLCSYEDFEDLLGCTGAMPSDGGVETVNIATKAEL